MQLSCALNIFDTKFQTNSTKLLVAKAGIIISSKETLTSNDYFHLLKYWYKSVPVKSVFLNLFFLAAHYQGVKKFKAHINEY